MLAWRRSALGCCALRAWRAPRSSDLAKGLFQPTMPSRVVLLACVLLARVSSASHVRLSLIRSSEIPPLAGALPRPKADRDPTHISDFTDPDTGHNPFLDLPEGRTEAFNRRVMDQDRPLPMLPGMGADVLEGGAGGRPSRRGPGEGQRPAVPRTTFDFSAFTEASTEPDAAATRQAEDAQPVKYDDDDVQRSTPADVDAVTARPERPSAWPSATVCALVTGAGVAALAFVAAACWKRRRGDSPAAERTQPAGGKQTPAADSC